MRRKYGLIGHPLGHTLSPFIHRQIMLQTGIDGIYRTYDLDPADFITRSSSLMHQLDGFNITIPYKTAIVPLLKDLEDSGRQSGAVNTVYQYKGYNTDAFGFHTCNIPFAGRRVLLLGAGGVARVMFFEAVKSGAAEVIISSRTKDKAMEMIHEAVSLYNYRAACFSDEKDLVPGYDVIMNATPVGMWPHCEGLPLKKQIIASAQYVFDSIYNPLATRMIITARFYGVEAQSGLQMLYMQALEAQKLWNPGVDFSNMSFSAVENSLKRKLLRQFPIKLVLTGFMGSGKTCIGKALAKALGIRFADLDTCVVTEENKTIVEIFEQDGEQRFRNLEKSCLEKLMKDRRPLVIATGGGALMNSVNVETVRMNQGFIFFLNSNIETILRRVGDGKDRPLLKGNTKEKTQKLYAERMPSYHEIADCMVDSEGDVSDIVRKIVEILDI